MKSIFFSISLILAGLPFGTSADAQTLYKYVDADGKVTYSDRVPKPGEKAEAVKTDLQANVVAAPKNTVNGVKQTITDINARGKQLEVNRATLQKEVDAAREQVSKAKKALEDGQEALQMKSNLSRAKAVKARSFSKKIIRHALLAWKRP